MPKQRTTAIIIFSVAVLAYAVNAAMTCPTDPAPAMEPPFMPSDLDLEIEQTGQRAGHFSNSVAPKDDVYLGDPSAFR